MARYQYDEEPMTFIPYVPGHVTLSRFWFATLSLLAFIGVAFVVLVVLGV